MLHAHSDTDTGTGITTRQCQRPGLTQIQNNGKTAKEKNGFERVGGDEARRQAGSWHLGPVIKRWAAHYFPSACEKRRRRRRGKNKLTTKSCQQQCGKEGCGETKRNEVKRNETKRRDIGREINRSKAAQQEKLAVSSLSGHLVWKSLSHGSRKQTGGGCGH